MMCLSCDDSISLHIYTQGNLQIVKLLIEKGGANPDDKEALSLAKEDDHTNVYEYLLEHVNAYGDFENMYIGSSSDESSYDSTKEEVRKEEIVKEEEAVIVTPRNVDKPNDTPTPTIVRSGSLLTFSIPSSDGELSLKLNQSKSKDNNQGSNETNTGFVMWPSAVMLSHHLTQNPDIVLGNSGADANGSELDGNVMELGSGCGLAGLTAATLLENSGSPDKVIFTDYNPSVLENLKKNVKLNEFEVEHKVLGLDWFDQQQQVAEDQIKDNDEQDEDTATSATAKDSDENSNTWVDINGIHHDQARLIIGSDLIVCSNDAELVAATLDSALLEGGEAIIIGPDSSTRFGVKDFPNECRLLGLDVEVNENVWQSTADHVDGDEEQLKTELELGGYDQRSACAGHDFTMFTIHKPISVVPAV